MHHHGLEAIGVAGGQQGGHAGAGGQPGDGDAVAVHRVQQAGLVDRIHDQRGFAIGAAFVGIEPVPAALAVGEPGLLGVQDQKALALGDAVHAGAGGKGVGVLPAAVQHHHQRQALAERDIGWAVQPKAPRAANADGHAGQPCTRTGRWFAARHHRLQAAGQRAAAGGGGQARHRNQAALESLAPTGSAGPHAFDHWPYFAARGWACRRGPAKRSGFARRSHRQAACAPTCGPMRLRGPSRLDDAYAWAAS